MIQIVTVLVSTFLPVVIVLVSVAVIAGILAWQHRKLRLLDRQSPLTREMLRPPGHTLMRKIQDTNIDLITYFAMLFATPLGVYSVHISQSYFAQQPESVFRVLVSTVTGIAIALFLGGKTLKLFEIRKRLLLGHDGELATGEELNQLMLEGCRVFHDVPFQYGNIDHVVVSRSGVFSVNTKCWSKPKKGGDAKVVVDHKRDMIKFPDREEAIPTKTLLSESKWLSKQLSQSVGEPIEVEPILALPGWFIDQRIGRGVAYVINPREPRKFFVHQRTVLSPKSITQIAHQLEQLCRDITPVFKENKSWTA